MNQIDSLFDNLDSWRQFPAYQLERRADIFFSLYLAEILSQKFGVTVESIIPEFPIRIGTIHSTPDINKSFKVDYLAKVDDGKTFLFVELKTDDGSRKDKQDGYLQRAKEVGLVKLLDGLCKIYQATSSKKKYAYLFGKLQDMGLITVRSDGRFNITQADYAIQIVYIQPNNFDKQETVVTFREISAIVQKHKDDLSQRFAKSLLNWANVKAGEH